MAKLLKGAYLVSEICSLIDTAQEYVIIACPYIALHQHYKHSLKTLINRPHVNLKILYGKYSNGDDYQLNETDFDFFKTLPNIEVRYNRGLHAKYYCNENNFISTSLNINYSSHNSNHEFGLKFSSHHFKDSSNYKMAKDLHEYIIDIYNESEVKYAKNLNSIEANSEFYNDSDYHERINTIKKNYPNAYERWTIEDDNKLELQFCQKKSIEELAVLFGRQPSAIRSRIDKLELYEKYGY